MKKLVPVFLTICTLTIPISACNTANNQYLPIENNNITSNSTINNQYIITAYAIVDKYPSVGSENQRKKLQKDFEKEIGKVNRFSVQKILEYIASIIEHNSLNESNINNEHLYDLVDSCSLRLFDIRSKNYVPVFLNIFNILNNKDKSKTDYLLKELDNFIKKKKVAKTDLEALLDLVNRAKLKQKDIVKKIIEILESNLQK